MAFKIVYELEAEGKYFLAFSRPYSLSLHEKSALRPDLERLLGRKLTADDLAGFDLETLLGTSVRIQVEHEETDRGIFANIAHVKRIEKEVEPSGDYVRVIDRDEHQGGGGGGGERQAEFKSTGGSAKSKKVQKPDDVQDPGSIRVHIGRYSGQELSDLAREDIQKLIERWLEGDFKKIQKPSADDRRLASALRAYIKRFEKEDKESAEGDSDEEPDDLEY
jgi:hypothetical protein